MTMDIILAGYNIDAEVIAAARAQGVAADQLTPETLSAAYARISRSPAPVDELRREARREVARARASNEQIVFAMGHASVAEHAVFNFDLMGISRLAIEAVESFRLCSYTEKSQRYVRLDDDVVEPREVAELGLSDRFRELVARQCRCYHELYEGLLARGGGDAAVDRARRRLLEGQAKEDARYVTPLATAGQLGLTLNARNLELMIRRLRAHPLAEVREIGETLERLSRAVAPSLIRYTAGGAAERAEALGRRARELLGADGGDGGRAAVPASPAGAVRLIDGGGEGDLRVVTALLHGASSASWADCLARARALAPAERAGVVRDALRPLSMHDAPPRALELCHLRFELEVSASCFAQLKRHRMATLTAQPYDPALGCTVPPALIAAGLDERAGPVFAASAALHRELARRAPAVAPYALTQGHRRRVLLQMNARELYHFARLRQDQHAQWDIRAVADQLLTLARRELPLTLMLACAKDRFADEHARVFRDEV